ncbi:MAG: hypothetical protein E7373_06120 [Clostridiales bacterium]|nr:hypothetical protein [Clostridiales bacterium]
MEKIYGYKEKDVIGLAEFLKSRQNVSLTSTFTEYGRLNKKAKGTVRNLYYALAKLSVTDKEFCQKYLDGKPLQVSKIVEFNECEERQLIKKILIAKNQGLSVRSEIMKLANGDGKIALRYQNKYRNAIKNNPKLISEIINELSLNGINVALENKSKSVYEGVTDEQFNKLKNEINNLVGKISLKTQKENEFLKQRIIQLEKENLKLYTLLYGTNQPIDALKFFKREEKSKMLN